MLSNPAYGPRNFSCSQAQKEDINPAAINNLGPGETGKNEPTSAQNAAGHPVSGAAASGVHKRVERYGVCKPSSRLSSTRYSPRASERRDATLIYHASTYDVDGSRTLRDKTNRRQLAVAVCELSRTPLTPPLFTPPRVILPESRIKLG